MKKNFYNWKNNYKSDYKSNSNTIACCISGRPDNHILEYLKTL